MVYYKIATLSHSNEIPNTSRIFEVLYDLWLSQKNAQYVFLFQYEEY